MKLEFKLYEREINFTRAYKKHIRDNKAVRELECLKIQIPTSFRRIKDKDLFAGRIQNALVGFYPLLGADGMDKVCYCFDQKGSYDVLKKIQNNDEYDEVYEKEVVETIKFWEKENTNSKCREAFTETMKIALAGDEYLKEVGAAYPLYRMAGVHLDYKKLLRLGINGLISEINLHLENTDSMDSKYLYSSMIGVLNVLKTVCDLYIEDINLLIKECKDEKRSMELEQIKKSLKNIKEDKPKTLHEAIQLITIYGLSCGATEIGRIDDYLCEFYINDLRNGVIDREIAARYVNSYFTLIEENLWRDSRAIIGGFGRENEREADEFALVVLEALKLRLGSYLPQISLRHYKGMDERVYDEALNILGGGSTFPILYNDDVNVKAVMHAMEVPQEIAEQYAFFGCGEYMLASKSIGTPNALLNLAKVLEVTLNNGIDLVTEKNYGLSLGKITDEMSFEELMAKYKAYVDYFVDQCGKLQELVYDKCNEESSYLMFSILHDDCIGRGKAMLGGGLIHLGGTLETYGNITASDSLAAIKEVVYDKKLFTLTKLLEMIKQNFQGFDKQRQALLNAKKFGNDYKEADDIAVEVHEYVCNAIRNQSKKTRMDSFLVVMINNNMNILLGSFTGATADGRKAKEHLSNGNGAYNGMDKEGITALMKSMTKLDTSIHAGANHNFKFSPSLFNGNREKIKALLEGYFALGGQQTNISVVNQKDLEDAMINPQNHENLMVRVGGYTARFIYLDKETQLEVLKRTAY